MPLTLGNVARLNHDRRRRHRFQENLTRILSLGWCAASTCFLVPARHRLQRMNLIYLPCASRTFIDH